MIEIDESPLEIREERAVSRDIHGRRKWERGSRVANRKWSIPVHRKSSAENQ